MRSSASMGPAVKPRDDSIVQLTAELTKLDLWLDTQQFHLLYDNILRIRKKLQSALARGYYLGSYLEDARAVNAVLDNPRNKLAQDTLDVRTQLAMGAAHPERRALGMSLMLLGIGVLVLGMLVISAVLACSFPLAGLFLLLGGAMSFTAGISFFRSGRQKGMASELDTLASVKHRSPYT